MTYKVETYTHNRYLHVHVHACNCEYPNTPNHTWSVMSFLSSAAYWGQSRLAILLSYHVPISSLLLGIRCTYMNTLQGSNRNQCSITCRYYNMHTKYIESVDAPSLLHLQKNRCVYAYTCTCMNVHIHLCEEILHRSVMRHKLKIQPTPTYIQGYIHMCIPQ